VDDADATVTITIPVPAFDQDALLALISDWPLHGVLQESDRVEASLPVDAWTDDRRTVVEDWLDANGYGAFDVRLVPSHNWNRAWEDTVTPIRAGPFLLTPTWADVPPDHADATVIAIDPKMSFGTGHHATTRLVLRLLPDAVTPSARVLDAGTGTGVLAIAAVRCGAASVVAFDVRDAAVENAAENVAHNGVADAVTLRAGPIDAVPDTGFDLVCANITREVLRDLLPAFRTKLEPGGTLLLSGILDRDRAAMVDAAAAHGFVLQTEAREDGWWAGRFALRPPPADGGLFPQRTL
jgi:ribosomal protein L11 methyltransferase